LTLQSIYVNIHSCPVKAVVQAMPKQDEPNPVVGKHRLKVR